MLARSSVRLLAFSGLLCLLLLSSAGCLFGGADASEGDEFALMEFDDEEPTPEPVEERAESVSLDLLVLEEINYLYARQVMLEQLQKLNRDLTALQELETGRRGGQDEDIGLDWVIDVFEVVYDADELFNLVVSLPVPDYQREKHADLFISELEAVQVMSFGSARLLEAATVIGPGGREVDGLSPYEFGRFHTLVREAGYFLRDSGSLIERQLELLSATIGRVYLR